MRLLALTVVFVAGCVLSQVSHADTYSPRQYYGAWNKHPTKPYHYRSYYYKPTPTYYGYKHHYVTYHPTVSKKNYYYYNPYQKKYWGRIPCECEGKAQYEILEEEYRKPELASIPEKAFQPIGKMPPVPESKDNIPMDLPPDDSPVGVSD